MSIGAQQVSVVSRNPGVTIWADGVKIVTDAKPVEMAAVSTGGVLGGLTRTTENVVGSAEEARQYLEEHYGTSQYDQYQFDGSQYVVDDPGAEQYVALETETAVALQGEADDDDAEGSASAAEETGSGTALAEQLDDRSVSVASGSADNGADEENGPPRGAERGSSSCPRPAGCLLRASLSGPACSRSA